MDGWGGGEGAAADAGVHGGVYAAGCDGHGDENEQDSPQHYHTLTCGWGSHHPSP